MAAGEEYATRTGVLLMLGSFAESLGILVLKGQHAVVGILVKDLDLHLWPMHSAKEMKPHFFIALMLEGQKHPVEEETLPVLYAN